MNRIVVDAELMSKLGDLTHSIELCDESGRLLGVFEPVPTPGELARQSPFSTEEIERRRQQRSGRAIQEILADLRSR